MAKEDSAPIQPVDNPIICSPYNEPDDHWLYDRQTGLAKHGGTRRPAGYWYKTDKVGESQGKLFLEEQRDDLVLVNRLREDVRRWREVDYRGATNVTKDLLRYWAREDRERRLFFCQLEAVETIIYLSELRIADLNRKGRSRTGFDKFEVSNQDIENMLNGEKPSFDLSNTTVFPSLTDKPADDNLLPLRRLGCKMATGSGKTVVMAMLISWAFCNRAKNPRSEQFPDVALICCPNLTVKERLQVLRPQAEDNYYDQFDMLPPKYRQLLNKGSVLVTNWHIFSQPDKEGQEGYTGVRNRGVETPEDMARRVLGEGYKRAPIMVLNDEGHHCWRYALSQEDSANQGGASLESDPNEQDEARVWLSGLDRINNAAQENQRGIGLCVDLSATPFYLKGSGHPEGRPFPWLVSDFGLVDAIESGITKIPRLPVQDTTGRPEPKYFKLWDSIKESLEPAEFLPGRARKPKPEVVWRESEDAITQLAGQWVERFEYMQQARPGYEQVPPVMIIVCDNTDIAEVFYQKISGEHEQEIVTEEDIEKVKGSKKSKKKNSKKPKTQIVYGNGEVYSDYFSNHQGEPKRTIRIDSKLLSDAEAGSASGSKAIAAEQLRQVVSTVGKTGQPGEHIRCVVSVSMLTEGWDANNVTHILGLRAFGSQLLCEQVVGRGLRRMDYTPSPETGMLTEEYVDVYGIPFSVIPFKGRPSGSKTPEDKPKHHIKAIEQRGGMEMRFPVVEGYAFALKKCSVRCDVERMESLILEPDSTPTATFVLPTVGYKEGSPAEYGGQSAYQEQNREAYYKQTHLQEIQFQITRLIVEQLATAANIERDEKRRVLKLQAQHLLFPQIFVFVRDYVKRKVDFQDCNPCELGLQKYVQRLVARFGDAIEPDNDKGEPPILPVLNRHKQIGTTAEVNFKTTRPCHMTEKSHINQVVMDTTQWEQSAAFKIEQAAKKGNVLCYARNDHLGMVIPYEYQGIDHSYEPDFLVRLKNNITLILEIKGREDDKTKAKHDAAKKWVRAVNNWGQMGKWEFYVCRNPQKLDQELETILLG